MLRPGRKIAWFLAVATILQTKVVALGQDGCQELSSYPNALQWQREYRNSCLSLDLVGYGESSPLFFGSSEFSNWSKWKAFRGFDPISESEFLKICGFEREAALAAKHHRDAQILEGGGYFLGLVGTIGILVATNAIPDASVEEARRYETVGWFSVGTMIVGLGMIFEGEKRGKKNLTPYSLARDLASDYNDRLCRLVSERARQERQSWMSQP